MRIANTVALHGRNIFKALSKLNCRPEKDGWVWISSIAIPCSGLMDSVLVLNSGLGDGGDLTSKSVQRTALPLQSVADRILDDFSTQRVFS